MKEISMNEETRTLSFSEEMLKKIESLIDNSNLIGYEKEDYKKKFNSEEIS